MELFAKAGFSVLKWHSGINNDGELTYVIELFTNNTSSTEILGLGWNKT